MTKDEQALLETLLQRMHIAPAVPLLEKAVAAMPKGWKWRDEHPDRIEIAFWDQKDFIGWIAASKPAKKLVWKMPSYSRYLYYLAFAAVERNELDVAEKFLDRALALEPDHSLLMSEKALIASHRGKTDDAIALYRRAIANRPWNGPWVARALRGIGFELIEQRRLDEAQKAFEESLQHEPDHPVAKNELQVIADLRKGYKIAATGLTRGGGEKEAQNN